MVNLKLGKEMENYDFSPRTASVVSGWASERVIQYKFLKSSLNIADVVIFFKCSKRVVYLMSALQLTLYWNYIFSVKDIYDYPHHEFLKVLFSQ